MIREISEFQPRNCALAPTLGELARSATRRRAHAKSCRRVRMMAQAFMGPRRLLQPGPPVPRLGRLLGAPRLAEAKRVHLQFLEKGTLADIRGGALRARR